MGRDSAVTAHTRRPSIHREVMANINHLHSRKVSGGGSWDRRRGAHALTGQPRPAGGRALGAALGLTDREHSLGQVAVHQECPGSSLSGGSRPSQRSASSGTIRATKCQRRSTLDTLAHFHSFSAGGRNTIQSLDQSLKLQPPRRKGSRWCRSSCAQRPTAACQHSGLPTCIPSNPEVRQKGPAGDCPQSAPSGVCPRRRALGEPRLPLSHGTSKAAHGREFQRGRTPAGTHVPLLPGLRGESCLRALSEISGMCLSWVPAICTWLTGKPPRQSPGAHLLCPPQPRGARLISPKCPRANVFLPPTLIHGSPPPARNYCDPLSTRSTSRQNWGAGNKTKAEVPLSEHNQPQEHGLPGSSPSVL